LCAAGFAQDAKTSLPTPTEILQQAEAAMGGKEALAKVTSISAIASCRGPKGAYETRLVSDRLGNLSFQQFLPDHKNIEGIHDGRGWSQNPDGTYEWVDSTEIFVLRAHDFPMMAIDLARRFHDFKTIGRVQYEGQPAVQVDVTDELGHPTTIYFSSDSHLPLALTGTNPRAATPPTVTSRFDAWRSVNGVKLVSHVTILYGSDSYVFDFKTLTLEYGGRSDIHNSGGADEIRSAKLNTPIKTFFIELLRAPGPST
jgi:hypothetical protein